MAPHLVPNQDEHLEWLTLDIVNAFWIVPLRLSERMHFTRKIGDKFSVSRRADQGSRVGFSLVDCAPCFADGGWRLLGFCHPIAKSSDRARQDAEIRGRQCLCVRGSKRMRSRRMALVILIWRALGRFTVLG